MEHDLPSGRSPVQVPADDIRVALVCDVMDAMGVGARALGPDISALRHGPPIVGRAFTVRCEEVEDVPEMPYVGLLRALDAVGAGEIFVLASGRTERSAMWGELLSTTCLARGVAGVVTDGYTRDSSQVAALGFPTYCRGTYPVDVHTRCEVTEHGGTVVVDGVTIEPGDLIVADDDGVVVVPAEMEQEVLERARAKSSGEDGFRDAVRAGMLPSEAYNRFKVL